MIQDIRLYKRFDADLISLYAAGCSLGAMVREVLLTYAADGAPVRIALDAVPPCDLDRIHSVRLRIKVTEKNAVALLLRVKKGYRNAFCKALLRDALIYQNFGIFFTDKDYVRREEDRFESGMIGDVIDIAAFMKKRPLSETGRLLKTPHAPTHQRDLAEKPVKQEASGTSVAQKTEPDARLAEKPENQAPGEALNLAETPAVPEAQAPNAIPAPGPENGDLLSQFEDLFDD